MNRVLNAIAALLILGAQGGNAQTINGEVDTWERIDLKGIAAPKSISANTGLPKSDSESVATREPLVENERERVPTVGEAARAGIKPSNPNPEATRSTLLQPDQPPQDNDRAGPPIIVRTPGAITHRDPNAGGEPPPQLREFSTRHARYFPVSWLEIPDWHNGVTVAAWNAFVQGCAVLIRQSAWRDACELALAQPIATADSAREFFEREFVAFQIRTISSADTGVLTGYYEPLLNGSRTRTPRFRYPVYGVPDDLLFLEAQLLRTRPPGSFVRIDGKDVVPVGDDSIPIGNFHSAKVYRLAVRAPAIPRDGKIRVRVSGNRIVPYFTRQEIERRGLSSTKPIVWVDDPDMLHDLHVEGSGRIKFSSGETLRVTFAEQNGHPYRPARSVKSSQPAQQVIVPAAGSAVRQTMKPRSNMLSGTDNSVPPTMGKAIGEGVAQTSYEAHEAAPPHVAVSSSRDPSYVFFRQIPNSESGPPGTMRIPLTPDASIAVDPRVTPLGAPVFIAARPSGSTVTTKRLMVAQDTGGAIRGALRADYFLGFGPAAATAARRMKDELRMWLLLPKRLAGATKHAERASNADMDTPRIVRASCLLVDPDFCAE